MAYEIHKGVPVPPKGLIDTIRKMECGDSIVIPVSRRVAAHTSARSIGARVKTRSNQDGTLTVWRIDSPGSLGAESVFDSPIPIKSASAVVKPASPPSHGGPVPEWPKIARTVAGPGLPEGYYIRRDPYSPELWIQGPPPEGPYSQLKETVFERHQTNTNIDTGTDTDIEAEDIKKAIFS